MLVIAFLSVWGAAHDRGPFTGQGPLKNALSLQLFLFFAAIPFMVLAVLVEEEKQTRQQLIEERAQLTEAQRLAQMGSWRWEPATDTVTWSEELYRIAGRDPLLPAPRYKEHGQFFTSESWGRLQSVVEKSLRSGRGSELDLEMVRPDGSMRWLMTRVEPQRDEMGLIGYVHGTVKDITERKRAEEALSTVSQKLIEAQEEERTRIARELHDDINQRLALLAVRLDSLHLPAAAQDLRREVGTARKQVEDLGSDVQALSHRLHSSKLEHLGLVAAAAGYCKESSDLQKVKIEFQADNIPADLSPEISLSLFRVLQEALQNAMKHSGSRLFQVLLKGGTEGIELTVQDSGVGFEPEAAVKGPGLGLTSMKERLKLVDGQLSIHSRPQQGTTIHARVPLNQRTKSVGAAG
jgi:signal transduction histidine kinase